MRHVGWAAAVLAWALVVGGGWVALERYRARPGDPGDPPATWPADSVLARAEDRPTLVMWAHPRCPCTEASVAELARLVAVLDDRVLPIVALLVPADGGDEWRSTPIRAAAEAIPRVRVVEDVGHVEAGRFGAATSGHVVLYGPEGDLWFSGGLTPSRGHQGDSVGRGAILERVLGGDAVALSSAVYGCGLVDAGAP